jgi:hypothetical protein
MREKTHKISNKGLFRRSRRDLTIRKSAEKPQKTNFAPK